MSQNHLEQFNQDYITLEDLEDLIDSAELQLQKTVTLLQLGADVEQSFEGTLSAIKDVEEATLKLVEKDSRFIASERIKLLSDRMKEVVNQYKI